MTGRRPPGAGKNLPPQGFATRAIHYGYDTADNHDALAPPIYLTATYAFPSAEDGAQRFAGGGGGYTYSRVGNPTVALLEDRLANLEGGAAALAVASGMGAIAAPAWTLLKPGDEIVTDHTLYGCTFSYFSHGLARFGVRTTHVDMGDLAAVRAAVSEKTRLVFFETPANPNMRLVDIAEVSKIAHRRGALVMVDNTYATPVLTRPIELGADIVVHSATKYLGGHGDLLAGAVVASAELIEEIRFFGLKDMTGACISPFNAFLVLRGLKTLELRMERHCATAQVLAERLAAHAAVASVDYPGLADFPQRDLARRQMAAAGGMIGFELHGGVAAGMRFMNALQLAKRAVSLGDAETLVQHPASMTHATYTPEERAEHLISDGLVRISVGLETPEDIWRDVAAALEEARTARAA
jgi:methionine-gamma-lyase